ncbi:MAG TPA: U32 family peptidase, partial [Candidatus Binatia bacterium]|nr:U32 family peptidase [Candidatus Binatia bacterium]
MVRVVSSHTSELEHPAVLSAKPVVCPELLAPAGNWDCARAAVENGADAIYFGLERFNARMRAHNFSDADLPKLMEYLHRRGVKGYITFNTLIFANELAEAERHLRAIITAGADAVIVQDVGICRLIRRISPDFPIHASTQMTITSAAGVEFARELGCELAVLARECSLKEIEKIRQVELQLPLEVFVHGALCVAYSGQCLTSEALGGRSANRGECAQACRMPYELISDGRNVPLGNRRYLLSPQDLAGIEVLPEIVKSGVASLKIEGRLKTPEYVANITRVYRQALDQLCHESGGHASGGDELWSDARYDLEMGFSRGLYTGWFQGINNQELVHARFGKKRGVYLGEVARVDKNRVAIKLEGPLKPGDGVVFDAGHPDQEEEGGRVYELEQKRGEALLNFGHGDIDFRRVHPGDKVWKTSDPELDRRLRESFAGDQPHFQRPISFEIHGREGEHMTVIARDELGHVAETSSENTLARAQKQPLTNERLMEQFGRLGGTPFKLGSLKNLLQGDVILPVSELNRLRRELVASLEAQRAASKQWTINQPTGEELSAGKDGSKPNGVEPELIVLVRNFAQLDAVCQMELETVYCEFEDPKKYREAVTRFRGWQTGRSNKTSIFVAPPRIFKMGEDWILKQVRSCEADGYLVRNCDHLKYFSDSRRIGDFSLNVANGLTAEYFIKRFGLERVTASYDLNFAQLEALLQSSPPEWYEVTIHQHMPMFHMEHCVFCAFLSEGTDYTNCGRPCDKHDVRLRDRVGAEHPLKADIGCRNTVFNALAQTGAEYLERMVKIGARKFRIEFLNESAGQVKEIVEKYRQLVRGQLSGRELWQQLKLINQLGVTRGQIN